MTKARQATLAQVRPHKSETNVIRADLIGSYTATALGITAVSYAPVIDLCRALVSAGHDPSTPLHAYRGRVLCLVVESIGMGADLEINARGNGFRPRRAADAASPIARKSPAATPQAQRSLEAIP